MKSKKPFFSRELIYNNLRRFWWVTALYTLALFLVSPLVTLTNGSDVIPKSGYNITFSDIFNGTIIFLFTVPVFIAVMVFRYMQNSKSMVTIHSMPYTRLRLYVNNLISGLILLIFPILLNAAFLSVIQLGNFGGTYFKDGIVLRYFSVSLLTSITLYAWTIFVGMFTGSSIAQIVFTYIINFLFAGLVAVIQMLLSGVLYGFVMNEDVCLKFLHISPIAQVMFLTDTPLEPGIGYFLIIDLVIGIIALVTGYFVYKYRNLETAGDVVSGKYIKPFFKYGVTVCVMLVGALYVGEIFSLDSVNIFVYLLFALIGYAVAEMLIRKSFKIWDSYKGFLYFALVFGIISFGISLDLFGYEKYVPEIDSIKCAALTGNVNFKESTPENPGYGVLYKEENIEKIIKLHESIAEDKNINLASDWDYGNSVNISYQLIDGRVVKRSYDFEAGRYEELLNSVYDSEEYIRATNNIFDYTPEDIYTVRIYNAIVSDDEYITVDNKEDAKRLFECMQKDILNSKTDIDKEYRDIYRVEIAVKTNEDEKGIVRTTTAPVKFYEGIEMSAEFIIRGFGENDVNVNSFILEKGYDKILKNNENITQIELRYSGSESDRKLISDKDKVNEFMDLLYNSSEEYNRYSGDVWVRIFTAGGYTSRVEIDDDKVDEVLKIFE